MRAALAFVVVIVLFFVLSIGQTTEREETEHVCVSEPDAKHTIYYNESSYRRIRRDTAMFYKEIPVHLTATQPQELFVNGKFYPSYVPWFDGNLENKYVNWRPLSGVADLLFVDITSDKKSVEPGHRYFDIYLKPGANGQYTIPVFINLYCKLNYPVDQKALSPDENGVFFPPGQFNTDSVTNWQDGTGNPVSVLRPNPNTTYYVFSYEHIDSPTGKISTNAIFARGEITVTSGSITKKYKVFYVPAVINYLALLDTDTSSPDAKFVYKYTLESEQFRPVDYAAAPTGDGSRRSLQLQTFNFPVLNAWGWWSPECKPAIYLYPKEKTAVNVQVNPAGYLTYSDPVYPEAGWTVTAFPDGRIVSGETTYPYLYYESKIADDSFEKPEKGYVVRYDELPSLFSTILPALGLTPGEVNDFKEYWDTALPESAYYFVGVMEKSVIDRIEHLTISPKEDTIVRVRLYFEALSEFRSVEEPVLIAPERKGFIVSEWGGMVKTDPNHPFTCSQ